MSSMSGPGQKLPRASMMRTFVATVALSVISVPSDEEGRIGVRHDLDRGGRARGLAHSVDQVLAPDPEHVHRHLARDELDAQCRRGFEKLARAGNAVLAAKGVDHP